MTKGYCTFNVFGKKKKVISVVEIDAALQQLQNSNHRWNTSVSVHNGIWAHVCKALGISNHKPNRYRLSIAHKTHYGTCSSSAVGTSTRQEGNKRQYMHDEDASPLPGMDTWDHTGEESDHLHHEQDVSLRDEDRPPQVCEQMSQVSADAVTLDFLQEARERVRSSPLGVIKTPMIPCSQTALPLSAGVQLKLENMQRTGSFKIRGVANQFARLPRGGRLVTMSAGNYGKSFAFAAQHYGMTAKVVMPQTAPESRSILIQSLGAEVERVPPSSLMEAVTRCVQNDHMTFLHSYDDLDLITGHASLGLEVLEAVPDPDVVVVCCGGGGLLAGVAAAVKLSGCEKTRIYGVEPEGACTMYNSFMEKKPVGMNAKSVASGLAPPSAGRLPFELCQRYVERIVLVSDEEIGAAVSALYRAGLVVEPSGSAAFAAIFNDRIPDLEGREVVCILSGGNVGKDELANFPG